MQGPHTSKVQRTQATKRNQNHLNLEFTLDLINNVFTEAPLVAAFP